MMYKLKETWELPHSVAVCGLCSDPVSNIKYKK